MIRGIRILSLSGDTSLTNFDNDFTASIFTSFSKSFRSVLKVCTKLKSVISLPKL
jgi:hypothetical protein